MPKTKKMATQQPPTPSGESALPGLLAAVLSCAALYFYYYHRAILLYGDAVAHINIARRVFDSRTPEILQLGTVWLPLPHLLDIPFIASDPLWQTGVGASIPSMAAFVMGAVGIYRLVRSLASPDAAWIAALVYMLNPNLLYMQATAMTESLYLALFIWAVVYFSEFALQAGSDGPRARKLLERCALVVAGAMLVRYDGWVLALAVMVGALLVARRTGNAGRQLIRGLTTFALLTGLTAGLWLAYNYGTYHNALEFVNGPYSARAIAKNTATAAMPAHPGQNAPRTAALYFLKVARLNVGEGRANFLLPSAAFIATLAVFYFARRYSAWTLLWIPLPFYVISVAWGSVPIYFPDWWPHSYYNVRYGLQLLPAFAVFTGLAYEFLARLLPARLVAALVIALVAASYFSVWRSRPITLREAEANGRSRMFFEQALARELQKFPDTTTFMMYCGAHAGVAQDAGIHLRRILNETNHPDWAIGLSDPARAAKVVIAFEGDDVWRAVRVLPRGLVLVTVIATPGQPQAFIYRTVPVS